MVRKSFKIECKLQLDMICVPHSKLCVFDHIYVNVELFGETKRSQMLHPNFPIKTRDAFYFEKVLWSPQTKKEALKLLKESPVSIELRHLSAGSSDSNLLAFADSNAHDFLVSGAEHDEKSMNAEKQIEMKQTEYHSGPSPKVKFKIHTSITCSETPILDELIQHYSDQCVSCECLKLKRSRSFRGGKNTSSHGEMYTCDCELHRSDDKSTNHCKICHQDRTFTVCVTCEKKLKNKTEELYDQEISDFEDDPKGKYFDTFRPPFVVRKVSRDIVARKPDAYDSPYNMIVREQSRLKSFKEKNVRRLRSCSPEKKKSERHSSVTRPVCYGCLIPPDEVRISCDACNLTYRGDLSNRNTKSVRPEPPLLKTYRETTDQRPIYSTKRMTCSKCRKERLDKVRCSKDDSLCVSSRPLYLLDGYRDMAKYFSPD